MPWKRIDETNAENVVSDRVTAIRGRRTDHGDAALLRDRCSCQRVGGRHFAQNSNHLILRDQLRDDGLRLLGLSLVVFDNHADLLAQQSTRLVDLVDGHLDAILESRCRTWRPFLSAIRTRQ